jgi:uncharacterized protein YdhG (YjbR/CyaY superfamily)
MKDNRVEHYLAQVEQPQRVELERIRSMVLSSVPDAIEGISYGMPGFKYKGVYLLGFGAFKNHMSLFPTSEPIEVLKEKLGAYTIAKGTIQFTLNNPLPDELIREILLCRINQIDKKK